MMMAGSLHPPFSLFGCAEKRKRAVHGPKEKSRWGENLPVRANFAQMRGSSQTVPGNLPVSIRLRLTAYRPLALCRSCDCQRGCFAGLTQGPSRRFPRFAHTLSRAGGSRVYPGQSAVLCAAYQIVDGYVEMVCQFPGGFYSRIILSIF